MVSRKKRSNPDPAAFTHPCSECSKTFSSSKALYGHMRSHPDRPWRGVYPPSNLLRRRTEEEVEEYASDVTEEDREVASCLLMLANSHPFAACDHSPPVNQDENSDAAAEFEFVSSKKVFSTHQAPGGRRASRKNGKGCFAKTGGEGFCSGERDSMVISSGGGGGQSANYKNVKGFSAKIGGEEGCSGEDNMVIRDNTGGHKCNICSRVFSRGQALGGHMRSHFEKVGEKFQPPPRVCRLDLNQLPKEDDDDDDGDGSGLPGSCGGVGLDLRLGF